MTVNTELKKLNGSVLRQLLPIHQGQLYQDDKIEQATDALTFAAGAAGFAFVEVEPRFHENRLNHTVDVAFDVKEGPRVYVERINVVGNEETLDYVIRRELLLSEGDAYNRVLVDRSKVQVRALGFFKDVEVTQQPGSKPDRTVLQVKVTEQPTGELSFSAGYSTVDKLVADIGVTQQISAAAARMRELNSQSKPIRQQLSLAFTESPASCRTRLERRLRHLRLSLRFHPVCWLHHRLRLVATCTWASRPDALPVDARCAMRCTRTTWPSPPRSAGRRRPFRR